jgi:hypothetical protein
MSHNATCTYNTPYRRKRYAVVQGSAEQRAADAENKIKALEDQLQVYKKKIHSLEKNLLQYLSPVPSETFSTVELPPLSHANELIDVYYDAGRWICSHFDKVFDEIRKQENGTKELTWQLANSFNRNFIDAHINQMPTDGLIDVLSWINVFLIGELLNGIETVHNDMVSVAVNIVTTLFFQRGIQFDHVQAQRVISNLVMLGSYLKLSRRMAAYVTTIGLLLQLVQVYENIMEPSLVFSAYSTLMVSSTDRPRRDSWMIKYYSQPVTPPLIEFVKFQLASSLSALLLSEIYSKQSMRTMIASVRELDESLEAIKDTKYYNFLKSWVCAADAEFAYNMDDLERYEAKKQQAVDHYNLIISPRLRMRLTTLFDTIILLVESRGLSFKGTSFKILQSQLHTKHDINTLDYYSPYETSPLETSPYNTNSISC